MFQGLTYELKRSEMKLLTEKENLWNEVIEVNFLLNLYTKISGKLYLWKHSKKEEYIF